MRVYQAGGHLMQQRGASVGDWSWPTTRRRFGTLWRLTRPYRGRTALSVISLLTATLTALAPPYLAKYALDDALNGDTGMQLVVVVCIFLLAGLWTPVIGTLVTVDELWTAVALYSLPHEHTWIHVLLAGLSASAAMLGPGAWSIDALLFGRKRFDIDRTRSRFPSP